MGIGLPHTIRPILHQELQLSALPCAYLGEKLIYLAPSYPHFIPCLFQSLRFCLVTYHSKIRPASLGVGWFSAGYRVSSFPSCTGYAGLFSIEQGHSFEHLFD